MNKLPEDPQQIVEVYEEPVLLMQADPRVVVTCNRAACRLFGKSLDRIEGFRGGQVFDCLHSFSEAGCGKDENCEGCKIKEAVIDTLVTGNPHMDIRTTLEIKKSGALTPYDLKVATEKIGDYALLTIGRYSRKS